MKRLAMIALTVPWLLAAPAFADGPLVKQACEIFWTASTAPDIALYKVFTRKDTAAFDFTKPLDVKPPATVAPCAKAGVTSEGQWFVVMRNLDAAGNFSQSAEVPFLIDATPPPAPVGLGVR